MQTNELILLTRDCEAVEIPHGDKGILPAGTQVRLVQNLGGSYTVTTQWGNMVRIAGKDADALGDDVEADAPKATIPHSEDPADLQELCWDQLRLCFDPEIPVNIVDLGLVYMCQVTPLSEGGNRAEVEFTLTAPGCGMGDVLKDDIETRLLEVAGITETYVDVTIYPPWDPSRMSEAARLDLGL